MKYEIQENVKFEPIYRLRRLPAYIQICRCTNKYYNFYTENPDFCIKRMNARRVYLKESLNNNISSLFPFQLSSIKQKKIIIIYTEYLYNKSTLNACAFEVCNENWKYFISTNCWECIALFSYQLFYKVDWGYIINSFVNVYWIYKCNVHLKVIEHFSVCVCVQFKHLYTQSVLLKTRLFERLKIAILVYL